MNSMWILTRGLKAGFAKLQAQARQAVHVRPFVSLCLAVAALMLAFFPSQASAETRALKLYYIHTGEKAEIAFKRNGRYLPDGLKRLNVFLRDWRHNEPTRMDPRLFDLIWQVYRASGSHDYIHVVSAYRSPATNAFLRSTTRGVAKKSQHMLGHAMDFFIPGVPLSRLRAIGMRFQIGGVGYYPRSGSPFVHMDVGNVRHWPRMSRRELLALFPDGKTVHIPSDGKPLPGYEAALAMVERNRAASGAGVMVAGNTSSPRRKSLLAALFGGGGADEAEDNSDEGGSAPAPRADRAIPVRQAPATVPQQRAAPNEPLVAALPARDAPVPMQAPRPDVGLDDQAPAAAPVTALANIPIPARKPLMPGQDPVALASADQPAEEGIPLAMNGFVPIPTARPDQNGGERALAAAIVPAPRPELPDEQNNAPAPDPIAALVNSQQQTAGVAPANEGAVAQAPQLAMVSAKDSGKDAGGELIAPPPDDHYDIAARLNPAPATRTPASRGHALSVGRSVDTGVRTTAKSGRYAVRAAARPRAVLRPAAIPASEVAMSAEPVARNVPATNPVLRNEALRSAPTMVYTAGFQRGDLPSARADKFTGNAVTFLTVAKFTATN
ncbi:MAG: DUF882 domain-containing protein [Rhizobiales bacterium]|nr:DUF882 domain-containing protein [Hyphomicrobiales bacterium]OJY01329.1 MAG: ATP-binding protein [Rhizobiales bacterium 63-22]